MKTPNFRSHQVLRDTEQKLKLDQASNEIVALLSEKGLSISEAKFVLQNAQEFIEQCSFTFEA